MDRGAADVRVAAPQGASPRTGAALRENARTRCGRPRRSVRAHRAPRAERDGGGVPRAGHGDRRRRRPQGAFIQYESDVVFYQRFDREEKIGQHLDHPTIVRVLSPEKKSRMYMVMELVEGKTLRACSSRSNPMDVEQALDIATRIASALVYLHARIVHRDLKPDNVLLPADGGIKLLDFGIAIDEAARRLTWFGLSPTVGHTRLHGTRAGPREARRRPHRRLRARHDALRDDHGGAAVCLDGNVSDMLRAKAREPPEPPTATSVGIDPRIEEIILHAIEPSPRDRYTTAQGDARGSREPVARRPRRSRHLAGRGGGSARSALPRGIVAVLSRSSSILTGLGAHLARATGAPPHAHRRRRRRTEGPPGRRAVP